MNTRTRNDNISFFLQTTQGLLDLVKWIIKLYVIIFRKRVQTFCFLIKLPCWKYKDQIRKQIEESSHSPCTRPCTSLYENADYAYNPNIYERRNKPIAHYVSNHIPHYLHMRQVCGNSLFSTCKLTEWLLG